MPAGEKDSVTYINQIYIRATPQAIWDAITSPKWNDKYGYQAASEYELKPGGKFRALANAHMRSFGLPEVMIDGEVIEVNAPAKLVQTYRWLFNEQHKAEGFTRVTYEIQPTGAGFCRLTVTHDVTGAPRMAAATQSVFNGEGGGGWNWILSDMKTLLETGKTMST